MGLVDLRLVIIAQAIAQGKLWTDPVFVLGERAQRPNAEPSGGCPFDQGRIDLAEQEAGIAKAGVSRESRLVGLQVPKLKPAVGAFRGAEIRIPAIIVSTEFQGVLADQDAD